MGRSTRIAAVLVATIFLANLVGATIGVAQNSNANVVVSETQNGSTIEVTKGQSLVIRLPAQLGTGFSWTLQRRKGISFELVKSGTEGGTGMPGAVETQVFVLKPNETGKGDIEFAYRQPWMRDSAPAKTFNLHIITR